MKSWKHFQKRGISISEPTNMTCVQHSRKCHKYSWGYLEYIGGDQCNRRTSQLLWISQVQKEVLSTMGDIIITVGGVLSVVEG